MEGFFFFSSPLCGVGALFVGAYFRNFTVCPQFYRFHSAGILSEQEKEGRYSRIVAINKQLLDEVEHDIMNYQNRGLCYLLKPKAEADDTDTRF